MNQVATTIKQSKELLKLGVSADTADMYWWSTNDRDYLYTGKCTDKNGIPAWSLAALMEIPKVRCNLHKYYEAGELVYRFESPVFCGTTAFSNPFDAILHKFPEILEEHKKTDVIEEIVKFDKGVLDAPNF